MKSQKYTWLLFDLDGTLFDYDSAATKALLKTYADFNSVIPSDLLTVYKKINGKMFQDLEAGLTTLDQLKVDRFKKLLSYYKLLSSPEEFSQQYLENLVRYNQLIPGAHQAVQKLSNQFKMMIITNGIASVQRPRLAQSSIAPFFSDLVISDEVNCAKPFKEIFEICFEKMNNPGKEQVLIIGDSLTSDIQGGINFGIDSCWYNPEGLASEPITPTYTIQHLSDLMNLFIKTS